jgi:hypothetical protein
MARWGIYNDRGELIVYEDNLPPGREVIQPSGLNFNWPKGGNYTNPTSLNQTANALQELSALHDTLLSKGNAIVTGTGGNNLKDSYAEKHPTTIVRRPWLDMPEGAFGFDPQQVDNLGVVGTCLIGVTVTVPEGFDGVINGFNWNFAPTTAVVFAQGSGDLKAQILRNGAAVRNYDNILMEKGCILSPRPINPLRIYSKQVIEIKVCHLANVLLFGEVITGLSGYFYPSKS